MKNENIEIIRKLNKGFETDDIESILECIADDIYWEVIGAFTANGKEEYRAQIHHEDFNGLPTIKIKNEIGDENKVAVEGFVSSPMKDGSIFNAYFHNAYLLENKKIKCMTSYLVPKI